MTRVSSILSTGETFFKWGFGIQQKTRSRSHSGLLQQTCTTENPEGLLSRFSGSCCFSTLDAKDAYLKIPLHLECSELTTINIPCGLRLYYFLPFGSSVSPAIFQSMINSLSLESFQPDTVAPTGIDAVLKRDDHPVVCVSGGRGYSQTQSETLAFCLSRQRLCKYLFDCKFPTVSDREALFNLPSRKVVVRITCGRDTAMVHRTFSIRL